VEKEVESYDLDATALDRDGQPAVDSFALLINRDTGEGFAPSGAGSTLHVRLPKGHYVLSTIIFDGPDESRTSQVTTSGIDLTGGPQQVVMDARLAKPVTVTIPRPDAQQVAGSVLTSVSTPLGSFVFGIAGMFDGVFYGRVGPDVPIDGFFTKVSGGWAKAATDGTTDNSPYAYNVGFQVGGRIPSGFQRSVRDADLARVRTTYLSQLAGAVGTRITSNRTDDVPFGGVAVTNVATPFTRTEFYSVAPGLHWDSQFQEVLLDPATGLTTAATLSQELGVDRRRGPAEEVWNRPMFGPGFPGGYDPTDTGFVIRQGDTLFIQVPSFTDQFDRAGISTLERGSSTTLTLNGQPIAIGSNGGFSVPAADGVYTLTESDHRSSLFTFSTEVDATFTFHSAHVDARSIVALPVSAVRFDPELDNQGNARAGRVAIIPVSVQAQLGATGTANRSLSVQISYDDGKTWTPVTLRTDHGRTVAVVRYPNRAAFVSLRASAADVSGNTVQQTVIRAYRIR
jgi:hypothetical protein